MFPEIFQSFEIAGISDDSPEYLTISQYWEIIADDLSKAGWSLGCVSTVDLDGRTFFVADAHRDAGKRLSLLSAFP
jgi:hypothetical protein